MRLPTIAAILALGTSVWAGGPTNQPTQSTVPAKKATTAATVKKTTVTPAANTAATVKKPVAGSTTAAAKRAPSKKAPIVRTTWRTRQTAPSSDRYREIQQALVARGYLSAEDATGTWGTASAEALKKFQAEQALESTGKLDSLSLIALGLGPRHDSTPPRIADGNLQPEAGHI